jgi:hypothetical protein
MRIAALRAYAAEVLDWNAVKTPPRRLLERLGVVKSEHQFVFGPDYPVQSPPGRISYSNFYLTRTDPAAAQMLEQIALLCRRHGLNCLYAHGPLARPALENADRYLAEAASGIVASGMTLTTAAPPPLAPEQVGNSEDHVAPPFKGVATRAYANIIRSHLR